MLVSIGVLSSCGERMTKSRNKDSSHQKEQIGDNEAELSFKGSYIINAKKNSLLIKKCRKEIWIKLIGINSNPNVSKYLSNLIGEKMNVAFDSSKPLNCINDRRVLNYAYVTLYNGESVNTYLIKNKYTVINPHYLSDSIEVFNFYQNRLIDYEENASKFDVDNLRKASFRVDNYRNKFYSSSFGSGFFISSDGYALSNHHVFEDGSFWVITNCDSGIEHKVFPDDIVSYSEKLDFILFKVKNLVSANYLNVRDETIDQGEDVYVYGNPKGLNCTLSKGIHSAFRHDIKKNGVIQMDAPISPGSSGGPIVDKGGNLIGMSTSQGTGGCQNCNFGMNIKELGLDDYLNFDK